MRIGYARVSTQEQDLQAQTERLVAYGCERVYSEKISSRKEKRIELERALDQLRPGDELVVVKLDRLARNVRELTNLVNDLERREVAFHSIGEGFDTSTTGGRLLFHIFAAIAEFERDIIRERTLVALESRRKRGIKGGRRPKLSKEKAREMYQMYTSTASLSAGRAAELYGLSISTFHKYIKEMREAEEERKKHE